MTDAFILSSRYEEEEALKLKLTKKNKIMLLLNPIETEKYKPLIVSYERPKRIVGMVARLVPQKNPKDFVRMAHHLNSLNSNVNYVLVGDGRLNSEVGELVSELHIHNLTMLGNRTDYIDVMSTFDVFVMTSLWEGLPYAPIEALLLGIPAVLTDVSGVRDLLQELAKEWIVPINSPEQMALTVNAILTNYSVQKQKVWAIRRTILEKFDSQKIGKQLGDYYKELLSTRNKTNENAG